MRKNIFLLVFCIISTIVAANPYASKQITLDGKQYYVYTVEKSEGFYAVSTKFGVTQDEIIAANPSTKDGLRVGQVINIPIKSATATSKDITTHTVEKGETIFSLSQRYGISREDIYALNPETREVLRVGSVIKLKPNASTQQSAKPSATAQKGTPVEVKKETQKEVKQVAQVQTKKEEPKTITPSAKKEEVEYINHKVRRRETLYSISQLYDVTSDEILAANPSAAGGLKHRSILLIPQNKKVEQVESLTEKAFGGILSIIGIDTANEDSIKATKEPHKETVKLAVLLPFELDAEVRDAGMDRFMEFYQGVLIAVDSLTNNGLNVEIAVHDIGKTQSQLTKILAKIGLKEADIIFGPAYSSQIAPLANFAKENKIKLVVPFSPSIPSIATNEFVYQVIAGQNDLNLTIATEYAEFFSDKLVYILQTRSESLQDKKEVVNLLKAKMTQKRIAYRTGFIGDFSASRLDSIANNTKKELVLIVPSTNLVAVTQLSNMTQAVQSSNIRIFSFSEWHQLQIQDLYNLPHYTYTNHYIDFKDEKVHQFFVKLNEQYGISGTQGVPNYALLGHDLAFYFLQQIQEYGTNFESHLKDPSEGLLQMKFQFEKVSPSGGYQNRGIFMQSYDKQGIVNLK